MTAPYLLRLACLSLASFFLLHLVLLAAVAACAGRAVRLAERLAPRSGARLLLALRLLPPVLAALVVAGVCVPSYLWLEPEATAEHVGLPGLVAAVAGAWICAGGLARAGRAALRSERYVRRCRLAAAGDAPVLMLAGVFRPRLVVSRGIRRALGPEQLAAALRHERAHRSSRDNLKRLLLAALPEALPLVQGPRGLERGWARMAEWAADDRAAAGNPARSLALAGALVRVARMGTPAETAPLATSLLADAADLTTRVDRLLNPPQTRPAPAGWGGLAAILAGVAIALLAQPGTLQATHRLLEALMR